MDMRTAGISAASVIAATIISLFNLPAQTGTGRRTTNLGTIGQLGTCLKEMEADNSLKGAGIAILAVTPGCDTLVSRNSGRLMVPASNMKMITTALALHSLGGDFRYETRIGYTGHISGGTLHGDLYIIGGGDPTLFSSGRIAEPRETVFGRWHSILSDAGIREIDGYIIGDGRAFPGMLEQESWQLNDSGTYYGTGISGLSFNENIQSFRVAPGEKPGDPVEIAPVYPEAPWMRYIYSCTTGKKGSGNTLYFYTSSLAPVGEMRGTFAIDRKPRTEEAANKFPEYTCAHYFTEYLKGKGMSCSGGPADLGTVFCPAAPSWKECPQEKLCILGGTMSPSLAKIAAVTNMESNNLYAEAMMKTIGMEYCGKGSYDSAYVAVDGILSELGISPSGARIRDGSGLSRENLVSPEFFCRLLMAMMDSPAFDDYLESLPYPGGEGTLKYMLKGTPEMTKTRIRMKSGSMGGVRCFTGYIIPSSGCKEDAIVFSVMINNFTAPVSRIQPVIEKLISLLAQCN
ncbi:MAG: D-alanyl-D-alanine carboxypeptidase/D-alanyl-D-alanine-endopeptidase [Bacteroidales bacterium]|nr:D-alanyl-D-alanine carboxypeptidase/D-alanyl-D-alanine-endopeptidase [Bacteroidales bacterium]